jgi:hypothetical protein
MTEKSNDEITLYSHVASFVITREDDVLKIPWRRHAATCLRFAICYASIHSCFISIPVPANLPTNLSNVPAGLSC